MTTQRKPGDKVRVRDAVGTVGPGEIVSDGAYVSVRVNFVHENAHKVRYGAGVAWALQKDGQPIPGVGLTILPDPEPAEEPEYSPLVLKSAADAEIARLRDALRPFAVASEARATMNGQPHIYRDEDAVPAGLITWGDLRNAWKALAKIGDAS